MKLFVALALVCAWTAAPAGTCFAADNLARAGKASASSVYKDDLAGYAPKLAIDGDMKTRWGGKSATGEWLQIDWEKPQTFGLVILWNYDEAWNKNVPFTLQIWDASLNGGAGGFKDVKTVKSASAEAVFEFPPVTTTKLRVTNVITFWEIEVYKDSADLKQVLQNGRLALSGSMGIAVEGDLLGHLIGTVSTKQGAEPVAGVSIEASGQGPAGPWKQAAKTADSGFFSIDLPACLSGAVTIAAGRGTVSGSHVLDAGDIAQRLTPRPADAAARLSLSGQWDFIVDPPKDAIQKPQDTAWGKIKVPSHWEMEGFASDTGKAAYRRTFTVPKAWTGKRIKFRAEAIYSLCEVWVNGTRVGSHEGGATPFELDITGAAKIGDENAIAVLVNDLSNASELDAASYYAHFSLGGIWRDLEVFAVEPLHISRLALTTNLDAAYRDAELAAGVDIDNEQGAEVKDAQLSLTVLDPQGKPVALEGLAAKVSLKPWQRQSLTLKAKVLSPHLWSAEQPRLYKLKAHLTDGRQASDLAELPLGFRSVEIAKRTYLINGKAVKFWGACRHDVHPLLGRAITPEIARQDAELMKGANINALRATCYPPHPAVLDLADQLGLYVEEEAPICFAGQPYLGRPEGQTANLALAPLVIRLSSEMIERDRNHPSIVVWSQCNESVWGPILDMAHRFTRTTDPTRPVSAGQSTNLEIATYHCPTSMGRMADTAALPMPVLFDEGFPIFQGFGPQSQGLELDPGLRDYWVTAHFVPLEAILKSEHQFGAMIWAWADDAFLIPGRGVEYGRHNLAKTHFVDDVYGMPGRGIVADPMWGVVDAWRRPRPEWWLCKKLFSPIQIKEEPLKAASPITVSVENRNYFANLAGYTCKWQLAGQSGEIKPDVPPMSKGTLQIPTKAAPAPGDVLVLEFFDEGGRLIDGYRLAFKPHDVPKLPATGKPARFVDERVRLDFGSIFRMQGKDCQIAYDRTSGELVRGLAGRCQVLRAGPALHVMKSASPLEPCPAGWAFVSEQHQAQAGQAVLNWNGNYGSEFAGGFTIRMDDGGNVEVAYNFTYKGPGLTAREIGLSFELPLDLDALTWDRKAEWSYYPDDHIGRPQGKAMAHSKTPQTVPPGDRPFSLDEHAWGCNDFRSCKRNVYWAVLTDSHGAGLKVLSDGTQHVRATVGTRTISLKVLDYYGGVATGTMEWDTASYGSGKEIKTGDVLKGTVRLQLLPGKPAEGK